MSREDVFVSADWAEKNLNAENVVFVEVDEDTSAYDGGHIKGAVRLDWKTELQEMPPDTVPVGAKKPSSANWSSCPGMSGSFRAPWLDIVAVSEGRNGTDRSSSGVPSANVTVNVGLKPWPVT